ncbi:MAG: 50S ribosomal protein L29 [Candidatus Limnocylindrales bacterium]
MDIDKVRALTDNELGVELATQRRNLYDLRFQLATRQLTDHSQLTAARRTVARVLTVMTERGLDENETVRLAMPKETRQPASRGRVLGRGRGSSTASKTASTASSARKSSTSTKSSTKTSSTKAPAASSTALSGATGGNEE